MCEVMYIQVIKTLTYH